MPQGIIYKSVIGCWMLSLLASASAVVAAEGSNPWLLPQAPMSDDWQQTGGQRDSKQQPSSPASQAKVWRFVTPEILDSIKHQQMQMQMMPGQIVPRQRRVEPSGSCPVIPEEKPVFQPQFVPGTGLMPQSSYYSGQPVYSRQAVMPSQMPAVAPSAMHQGMNNTNPMYDTPAVSPWGQGADVLYRGESFPNSIPGSVPSVLEGKFPGVSQQAYPWVPSEAMGGLLPIPVSPTIQDSYEPEDQHVIEQSADKKVEKSNVEDVFNPFTFLPMESKE